MNYKKMILLMMSWNINNIKSAKKPRNHVWSNRAALPLHNMPLQVARLPTKEENVLAKYMAHVFPKEMLKDITIRKDMVPMSYLENCLIINFQKGDLPEKNNKIPACDDLLLLEENKILSVLSKFTDGSREMEILSNGKGVTFHYIPSKDNITPIQNKQIKSLI